MNKINLFFFMVICFLPSCIHPSHIREQFKAKPSPEVKKELESSIESHNWQYNGTEKRPLIAATPEELARLKSAWAGTGAKHNVLANRFAKVDKALQTPLTFPPEGGQHNQWYQCNICQRGLVTVDATHHKCPQCGRIYSGFPYDNVLYSNQHRKNFRLAEDAAWAWAVTGEKKYAELSAAILLGYAGRYLNYPMVSAEVSDKNVDVAAQKNDTYRSAGHVMEQTLDEAMLMIPAVTAYDLIYDSKALNPEDKSHIEDKLIRAMAECINVNKTGKSNWQTWHNAALMYAGVVLGDKQLVKQAVLDNENGFVAQMKISVLPEGMWFENSWGYHYYTLSAMTLIAEGGRRLGMDFYSDEMLHKMYLLAFDYRMADGSLPRFGDAVDDSPDNQSVNEPAYAVYKDNRLLATLQDEPTWESIMSGRKPIRKAVPLQSVSKLIPGAGHAILATDGPGKLTAAITFGPYGGFHGHYDKLSFVFFGYGKELAVDPGRAASQAYRLPIHREWYKATTGHNAILVDGQPQKEAGGQILAFATTPSYAAVAADAGPAFGNIRQRRFLLLSPTYLLVVDELRSDDGQEHSFDWLYHNRGIKASCSLPAMDAKPGEEPAGYSYLRDIAAYKTSKEEPLEVLFPDGQLTTRLTMIGHPGDEVFTATGPMASVDDRVPMVIVRRKGKMVYFITLLEPVAEKKQPDAREVSLLPGNNLSIKIVRSDREDQISFTGESLEKFTVTGKSGASGQSILLRSDSIRCVNKR
jgi:rubrerythrin